MLQRIKQLKDRRSTYDSLRHEAEELELMCDMALEENDESLSDDVSTGMAALSAHLEDDYGCRRCSRASTTATTPL